jgi:hypothetical protein
MQADPFCALVSQVKEAQWMHSEMHLLQYKGGFGMVLGQQRKEALL